MGPTQAWPISACNHKMTRSPKRAEYKKAVMQLEANEQLSKKGLIPDITVKQARLDADQLSSRYPISQSSIRTISWGPSPYTLTLPDRRNR